MSSAPSQTDILNYVDAATETKMCNFSQDALQ